MHQAPSLDSTKVTPAWGCIWKFRQQWNRQTFSPKEIRLDGHFCYLPCLTDDHRNLIVICIQSFVFPTKCTQEKDLSPCLKTLRLMPALQNCLTSFNLLRKPQILFAGGVQWQFRCDTGAQNIHREHSSTTLKNPKNKLLLLALPTCNDVTQISVKLRSLTITAWAHLKETLLHWVVSNNAARWSDCHNPLVSLSISKDIQRLTSHSSIL